MRSHIGVEKTPKRGQRVICECVCASARELSLRKSNNFLYKTVFQCSFFLFHFFCIQLKLELQWERMLLVKLLVCMFCLRIKFKMKKIKNMLATLTDCKYIKTRNKKITHWFVTVWKILVLFLDWMILYRKNRCESECRQSNDEKVTDNLFIMTNDICNKYNWPVYRTHAHTRSLCHKYPQIPFSIFEMSRLKH